MTDTSRIPFNRPCQAGRELEYLRASLASGHMSGDGPFSERCHRLLEEVLGTRALLTTSCTHALELAALLLEIGPEDEVVLPSFTFVSTANAFALRGARLRFVDIREDTLNLDETLLGDAFSERTRAVVPVHYAGVGCDMDRIGELAGRRGIAVVEDNAHGLFGRYRGRWLGTFGRLATLSFHETKNFSCGEGGALLVNDPSLVERAEVLREKGTNRKLYFRGGTDRYTWIDLGSSYLPADLLAAYLLAQLEARESIRAARKRVFGTYRLGLADWAMREDVRLPVVPPECEPSYHMFHLLLPTAELQPRFIAHLAARGIASVFHYQPLHCSPFGLRYGHRQGQLPITESVSGRLVRLPFYNDLDSGALARIVAAVGSFRC